MKSSEPGTALSWGFNSIEAGPRDAQGKRLLAAPSSHLWCTSNFGSAILRIELLDGKGMHTVLKRDVGVWRAREPVVSAKIEGEVVTFEFDAPTAMVGDMFKRAGFEKYRVQSGRAKRVAPFARNIVSFIEDWLSMDDAEVARISGPQAVGARKFVKSWHTSIGQSSLIFDTGRMCKGTPNVWEVEVGLEGFANDGRVNKGEPRTFLISEAGATKLRMLRVDAHPSSKCAVVGIRELAASLPE